MRHLPRPGKKHPYKTVAGLCALLQLGILLSLLVLPGRALGLSGQLNINSATATELEALPFTGSKRAEAIIRHRQLNGPFESIDDLLKVKDIGPSTFQAIRPYLKTAGPSSLQTDHLGTHALEPATANASIAYQVQARISTHPGEVMLLPDKLYFDTLLGFISTASQRIDMAMFLFKINERADNRPAAIMNSLIAAQERGVTVRVVLENSGYDDKINKINQRVAKKLRRHNIDVRFDSKDNTSHMKLVVIDNRFCFIGSHNLTHAALAFNHEFSILIDNRQMAGELQQFIDQLPQN